MQSGRNLANAAIHVFFEEKAEKASQTGLFCIINTIIRRCSFPMKSALLGKLTYHSAILLACFTLGARPQQLVLLTPGENDLVVLNGCVVSPATTSRPLKHSTAWRRISGPASSSFVMPIIRQATPTASGKLTGQFMGTTAMPDRFQSRFTHATPKPFQSFWRRSWPSR